MGADKNIATHDLKSSEPNLRKIEIGSLSFFPANLSWLFLTVKSFFAFQVKGKGNQAYKYGREKLPSFYFSLSVQSHCTAKESTRFGFLIPSFS